MLDDPAKYDAVMSESFSIINDFYKALGLPVTIDIADAADLPNIAAMSKIVKKYYLCWPKIVSL